MRERKRIYFRMERSMRESVRKRKMKSSVVFGQEISSLKRREFVSLIHFDIICRHLQRNQDHMTKRKLLT
jgi:hypothetical protein